MFGTIFTSLVSPPSCAVDNFGKLIRNKKQRIEAIKDDHVIMARGDQTYRLYLKGMSPRSRREAKK